MAAVMNANLRTSMNSPPWGKARQQHRRRRTATATSRTRLPGEGETDTAAVHMPGHLDELASLGRRDSRTSARRHAVTSILPPLGKARRRRLDAPEGRVTSMNRLLEGETVPSRRRGVDDRTSRTRSWGRRDQARRSGRLPPGDLDELASLGKARPPGPPRWHARRHLDELASLGKARRNAPVVPADRSAAPR